MTLLRHSAFLVENTTNLRIFGLRAKVHTQNLVHTTQYQ